jgi:spermidine/putrescine-binding protein
MKKQNFSRRDVLKGSLALGTVFASPVRAEAPPAEAITPQLIEAARKEAKVVLYSAMDLPVGEKLGKAFEAQYPGIAVQIERSGWRVMQVQSSTDPPKKLALGERAVMADGNEYNVVLLKEAGQPVEPIYPTEGTPTVSGPTGIFLSAPHPNAARLFQAWLHTRETQQFFIDFSAQYSVHAQVQSKPGRRRISDIKLMKEDPAGVEKMTEEIKTRYARLFRV